MLVIVNVIIMISIVSYNCHGFGPTKVDYINKLCSEYDFVLIQEHWLLEQNLGLFHDKIPFITCHGVSAIDSGILLQGRPHGGCSILWKTALACKVSPVDSGNCRVSAILIELSSNKILLVNFYMPIDTRYDHQNSAVYDEALAAAASLAHIHDVNFTIYGGDFNTDFQRHESLHSISLNSFIQTETIFEPASSIDYTFESMASGVRSFLDHFIVSENLLDKVLCYEVIHDGDNLSDHVPIRLTLDIPLVYTPIEKPSGHSKKLCWRKAKPSSIEAYSKHLSRGLLSVSVPVDAIECCDPLCTDHHDAISKYFTNLESCILSAGESCIPKSKPVGSRVPGWNDHVRKYKDAAIFWHTIWVQCERPMAGWVSQIRRHSRGEYKRAIRRVKRDRDSIVSNKMADSLSSDGSRDLWTESKKINSVGKPCPSNVDGKTGDKDIASVFADNYKKLYNSVSFQPDDMLQLETDLNNRIRLQCCRSDCYCSHCVSVPDIQGALKFLKAGKCDGVLSSDHILNACHELFVHLSLLFTTMIRHGFAPGPLLKSTVVPIPKNLRKSVNDSSNYRGIALNSPFSKVFELVVLCTHRHVLSSSDLQFGYKRGVSTSSCSFVAGEVIQEFLNGDNDVHVMLLDASKAFDCVNYVTLFSRLIHNGLCPLVCRVLLYMHVFQIVQVRWNSQLSDPFSVSNGVKQGGVLSPVLFSIYTDAMLSNLRDSRVGCYLGHLFAGALAYADDIVLLAPTKVALSRMLSVAGTCADELSLKFNGTKSQYLRYCAGRRACKTGSIPFCGVEVPLSFEGLHLGNLLGASTRQKSVHNSAVDLQRKTNVLLSRFSFCTPDVRYKLFKAQCVTAYGSQLWDFQSDFVQEYFTAWRKCVRRIWALPNMSHRYLLPGICQDRDIEVQLLSRSLNFVRSTVDTSNELLHCCGQLALHGSFSAVSNTIAKIADDSLVPREWITSSCPLPQSSSLSVRSGAIRDFAMALQSADGEDKEFLSEIIRFLCLE